MAVDSTLKPTDKLWPGWGLEDVRYQSNPTGVWVLIKKITEALKNAGYVKIPKTDAKNQCTKNRCTKTDAPKTNAKTDAPKTDAPKTNAPKTNAPKTNAKINYGMSYLLQ